MIEDLNRIIIEEIKALEVLLGCLDRQHEYIAKDDVFKMEAVVEDINNCNKKIAKLEMERRNITKGESMEQIVNASDYSELDENYRKARKLVEELKVQKETNEILIKQGLGYTTRMLQVLNPDRQPKTYGAYGKMKR
ncbi:FlgN protein [Clostridium liquoris]|uniref:FlgN protein n=1 Tax=Clostridium liquoris TaxID=1289519 RepID=A0A2T0B675_9CLOT|nr:flagellar protein FlgN [Clostridium liquoris]PRR79391.1 FlgN protein [Clostridium liquoris]